MRYGDNLMPAIMANNAFVTLPVNLRRNPQSRCPYASTGVEGWHEMLLNIGIKDGGLDFSADLDLHPNPVIAGRGKFVRQGYESRCGER